MNAVRFVISSGRFKNKVDVYTYCRMRYGMCLLVESPR